MQYKYKLWPLALRSNAAQMFQKTCRRLSWKNPSSTLHNSVQWRGLINGTTKPMEIGGWECPLSSCSWTVPLLSVRRWSLTMRFIVSCPVCCSVLVCICSNGTHINKIARARAITPKWPQGFGIKDAILVSMEFYLQFQLCWAHFCCVAKDPIQLCVLHYKLFFYSAFFEKWVSYRVRLLRV